MAKKDKMKMKQKKGISQTKPRDMKGKSVPKTSDLQKEKKTDEINRFEIHVNRSKHDVIGRKRKEDRGLPGVARAKALKKRQKTLLQEYKMRHKSNVFVDRRIGENDPTLDPEKKIAMRLAAVKIKHSNRKAMFNLNDDDGLLTHDGKALDDDNFDDAMAFSDEDEEDAALDPQFVKERHFGGGFMTKREGGDGVEPKSKKEWIDDIITESKKKKADAKRDKEEQYEAVTKLDKNLQDFMKLMSGKTMTDEDKDQARKNSEFRDYDVLVKELGFDRTGKAKTSTKLKAPEELVKEEKEKLNTLEADRMRRMQGKPDPATQPKSRSADDLDDGFTFNNDDRFHLSYKDGKMLKEDSEESDDGDAEESDDLDAEDNGEDDAEDSGSEGEAEEEDEEGSDKGENEMESGDDLEEEDESDQYSDIFDDESDADEDDAIPKSKKVVLSSTQDRNKKRESMEAARKEIPYTFEVPQEYESFWCLLENHSPKEVSLIMERMIACNHPSLGAKNKEKMEDLCTYILQTLNVLTEEDGDSPVKGVPPMTYVDSLMPHLYSVTQCCSSAVANAFRQVLEEKYEDCSKLAFRRYPMADCFVFLKSAGVLFPSSDFIHPVMTPVMTFLSTLLGQAKVNTRRDVTAALFSSFLLFEYLSLSKRFVPELVNVLNGLLSLAVARKEKHKLSISPPFKRFGPASELLVVEKTVAKDTFPKLTLAAINEKDKEVTDVFKVNVLCKTMELLVQLCDCWSMLPSIKTIMEPTSKLLGALSVDHYPNSAKEIISQLKNVVAALPAPTKALIKESKKPKPIKMFEPAIERVIEGMKPHGNRDRDFQEKQKLLHKLKKERKGARREIQRDTAFLARQQLKETLQSDTERKRKVNQILAGLQNQESDHKKLKFKKF